MTSPRPDRPFLEARWKNLLLFSYAVPDDVLTPFLPPGCELDRIGGSAYLSLVAFEFLDTKALGVRWPGFTDFPEVNLRFYVRCRGARGVCFVREFIPSWCIAKIANALYHEPYLSVPMRCASTADDAGVRSRHELSLNAARFRLEASAANAPYLPPADSLEHLLKEHSLGVGRDGRGGLLTYEVAHPRWRVYPIKNYALEIDWVRIYGARWGFLQGRAPDSVVFAEGSEVSVYRAAKISSV